MASSRIRANGSFRVTWHLRPYKPAPAPVPLPAGDGRIVGGVYFAGGPPPGVDECEPGPLTVTVTDSAGAPIATQTVTGRRSYSFVVPAGMYDLLAPDGPNLICHGTARVTAGRATRADTVCDVS